MQPAYIAGYVPMAFILKNACFLELVLHLHALYFVLIFILIFVKTYVVLLYG